MRSQRPCVSGFTREIHGPCAVWRPLATPGRLVHGLTRTASIVPVRRGGHERALTDSPLIPWSPLAAAAWCGPGGQESAGPRQESSATGSCRTEHKAVAGLPGDLASGPAPPSPSRPCLAAARTSGQPPIARLANPSASRRRSPRPASSSTTPSPGPCRGPACRTRSPASSQPWRRRDPEASVAPGSAAA